MSEKTADNQKVHNSVLSPQSSLLAEDSVLSPHHSLLSPQSPVLSTQSFFRREVELLLCCARTRLDAERAARISALLREEIDWERLLHMAHRHGMLPLLYWHLNATCPQAVPTAALSQLRDHFQANTRRNLFLTGELLQLLNLFETHRITAIPFKGPALAASVYGNLAFRQFADLDIFVRKQDVLRAGDLLVSLGYRPHFQLTRGRAKAHLRSQCDLVFTREDGRVNVELHWGIVPTYLASPNSPRWLWKRLDRASKDGSGLPALPPEDTLLILCVHGAKHLWERLGWICDIAELIRLHRELDWRWVMEQSRTMGGERMFYLGLFLARDLLGAPLPREVVQRLEADPVVRELAGQVREHLFLGRDGSPGLLESCLFHLKAMERLQDQMRYCVRLALTPTSGDWAFVPLPAYLSLLYYLLRPIRLAFKYGK